MLNSPKVDSISRAEISDTLMSKGMLKTKKEEKRKKRRERRTRSSSNIRSTTSSTIVI